MIKNCEKPPLTRQQVISLLSESAKFCAYRVTSDRCKPQEGDETRLKYARCLAQIAAPLLSALKDNDLEELEKRLDELEAAQR